MESDLPNLFVAVAEAAEERQIPVALLIDELQYFNPKELSALIMAMHKMQQRQLPMILLGAGLPILPGLAGESKWYAERLFSFPDIGALSESDAIKALREPTKAAGVGFEDAALKEIFGLTQGYPYFLQEWGYQAWNRAPASPITLQIVQGATPTVIARLDQSFFRVRFDRLTPSEKRFLRAMAGLGPGPHRSGDIADALGVKINSVGPVQSKPDPKGNDLQSRSRRRDVHCAAVRSIHAPSNSGVELRSRGDAHVVEKTNVDSPRREKVVVPRKQRSFEGTVARNSLFEGMSRRKNHRSH